MCLFNDTKEPFLCILPLKLLFDFTNHLYIMYLLLAKKITSEVFYNVTVTKKVFSDSWLG